MKTVKDKYAGKLLQRFRESIVENGAVKDYFYDFINKLYLTKVFTTGIQVSLSFSVEIKPKHLLKDLTIKYTLKIKA